MKSIDAINRLRREKNAAVQDVYRVRDLEAIYRRQTELNTIAIMIYTDAANAVMDVLPEDGANKALWTTISGQLDPLNFTGIPNEDQIRAAYQATESEFKKDPNRFSVKFQDPHQPVYLNAPIRVEKKRIPDCLIALAACGVAVPLIIHVYGKRYPVLATMLLAADGGIVAIEIIRVLKERNLKDIFSFGANTAAKKTGIAAFFSSRKRTGQKPDKASSQSLTREMIESAIDKTMDKNLKELNRWFDRLEQITKQEIEAFVQGKDDNV